MEAKRHVDVDNPRPVTDSVSSVVPQAIRAEDHGAEGRIPALGRRERFHSSGEKVPRNSAVVTVNKLRYSDRQWSSGTLLLPIHPPIQRFDDEPERTVDDDDSAPSARRPAHPF